MKTELTETLIRAFQQFAEEEMNANGESFPVHERLNDLGLSDETLSEIGLGWLVPEPDEPNEPQKKKWKVHIRETWEGDFEVEAADWDEAYALACDLEYASGDLNYTNREIEIEEQIKFLF